jgi:hypothetical protein
LGSGEGRVGEGFFVDGDEEAFAAGEDGAIGVLDLGLMEELAAGRAVGFPGVAEVTADEDERLVERRGAEVVDLHVAGHCEDVKRTVELAHSFVEERCDDAAVDVAGRALVHAVELKVCRGGDRLGVRGIEGEAQVQALGVGGSAAEAVVGALVDGGVAVQRDGSVAGVVEWIHGLVLRTVAQ